MFDAPEFLLLIVAIPVLVALFIWRFRVYESRLQKLADENLLSNLIEGRYSQIKIIKFVLYILAAKFSAHILLL